MGRCTKLNAVPVMLLMIVRLGFELICGCALLVGAGSENTAPAQRDQKSSSRILKGHPEGVVFVGFLPDGKTLVSGDLEGTVKLWDVQTGKEKNSLQADRVLAPWYSFALAPDGKRIAGGAD